MTESTLDWPKLFSFWSVLYHSVGNGGKHGSLYSSGRPFILFLIPFTMSEKGIEEFLSLGGILINPSG